MSEAFVPLDRHQTENLVSQRDDSLRRLTEITSERDTLKRAAQDHAEQMELISWRYAEEVAALQQRHVAELAEVQGRLDSLASVLLAADGHPDLMAARKARRAEAEKRLAALER